MDEDDVYEMVINLNEALAGRVCELLIEYRDSILSGEDEDFGYGDCDLIANAERFSTLIVEDITGTVADCVMEAIDKSRV